MSKSITVFTRQTCAPCKMLKGYLSKKNIPFTEINVDETPNAQEQLYELSGYSIVPLTVVTDKNGTREVITGLNMSKLITAIA